MCMLYFVIINNFFFNLLFGSCSRMQAVISLNFFKLEMPVLKLLETGFQPPASTAALTHAVTTINHYHHHNRQVLIPAGTINSIWLAKRRLAKPQWYTYCCRHHHHHLPQGQETNAPTCWWNQWHEIWADQRCVGQRGRGSHTHCRSSGWSTGLPHTSLSVSLEHTAQSSNKELLRDTQTHTLR